MEKIRIGQIGICHEHASGIMNSLRKLPDMFEIVGVVDDRTSTAAKFAGDNLAPYEGLKFMSEDELFNTPGLQAVIVETPNLDLVPTALRCAERNLAIHMDKPGGDDLAQFGRLLDKCKARQLPFQMGYMFRANPAMQWIRGHREDLGDIFEVQAGMSHNYGGAPYQEYLGSFPGGIMFNLGCHLIDFVAALMGRPTAVTPFLKSAPGFPDCVKNNCVAILEYPHTTVTLRACSQEIDGGAKRRLKVCGTRGSVELCPLECFDGRALQMNLVTAEGSQTLDFGVHTDRYAGQLMEFAGMVRGEIANPYTYEHDYLVQEILLAASGYTKWS